MHKEAALTAKAGQSVGSSTRLHQLIWLGFLTSAFILLATLLNPNARVAALGDDGLFFVRYAHNFLTAHSFSWLAGEPPSFGGTSQLFQLLVTVTQIFFRNAEPYSVVALQVIGGTLTAAMLLLLLRRELLNLATTSQATIAHAPLLLFLFGLTLIILNPKFYGQWRTGLETTWSTFLVALFVFSLPRLLRTRSALFLGLPLFILTLFWQRPDMGLIGTMPLLIGLITGREHKRSHYFLSGIIAALLLVATLIGWKLYYGTPVPLPSIVKTGLSGYNSSNVDRLYAYGNRHEFFLFCRENFIALLYSIGFFIFWRKFIRKPFAISDLSLVFAAIAYALFQIFGNKYPITTGGARFFMPILPILIYFAITGFRLTLIRAPERQNWFFKWPHQINIAAILLVLIMQTPFLIRDTLLPVYAATRHQHYAIPRDALIEQTRLQNKWNALLPELTNPTYDACSVADSEIGAIGLLPPSRAIFDMSGLNNTDVVAHHEPPLHYLIRKNPDYIFYTRIDFYWGLTVEQDPTLIQNYNFYPTIGLAVRRNSACTFTPAN